jgi:hypothetical protein
MTDLDPKALEAARGPYNKAAQKLREDWQAERLIAFMPDPLAIGVAAYLAAADRLSASPFPPALDGAGRDAVIEEIAKHFDRVSEEAEAQSVFAIYREIASEVRSLKETP